MKTKFDKDFEAWYVTVYQEMDILEFHHPEVLQNYMDDNLYDRGFKSLSELFGVYQDFGDSVGYLVSTKPYTTYMNGRRGFYPEVIYDGITRYNVDDHTRQEARQAAIDRFKDWYNEK